MSNMSDIAEATWDVRKSVRDIAQKQNEILEAIRALDKLPNDISKNQADVRDLLDAIANRRLIDAIRAHRSLTGIGLKESKDAIEAFMAELKT